MSELGDLQRQFMRTMSIFLPWLESQPGVELTSGDWKAHDGHMVNSVHYVGLAADLNLFINGEYITDTERWRSFGEYWKTLHPLARWGGDFPKPDGNHVSFAYQGRA